MTRTDGKRNIPEAVAALTKAKELLEELMGPIHVAVASCFHNLGVLYYKQEQFELAEKFFLKDQSITKTLLGLEHPYLAFSYSNLALVYEAQQQYDTSAALYDKAIEIFEKVSGPDDPDLGTAHFNYGILYLAKKNHVEQARAQLETARLIYLKAFGDNHEYTKNAQAALSMCA